MLQTKEVLNILNNLTVHQEDELYELLRDKRKEEYLGNYLSIQDKLSELREKYFDLVWYARKFPEDRKIKGVIENMTRIEKEYPEEIARFSNTPDWTHGFNSGALAILRLMSAYALEDDWIEEILDDETVIINERDKEIDFAEELFPWLDT